LKNWFRETDGKILAAKDLRGDSKTIGQFDYKRLQNNQMPNHNFNRHSGLPVATGRPRAFIRVPQIAPGREQFGPSVVNLIRAADAGDTRMNRCLRFWEVLP
jgi:hypothetical protein